jgi:hypothetical protein
MSARTNTWLAGDMHATIEPIGGMFGGQVLT